MRIAFAADEPYPVHETLRSALHTEGHDVVPFGACADGGEHPWADVAAAAAAAVASGQCDEGVFLCWSGTGISMAANKVAGIRAALCGDPATAAAARIWNHANVLCLAHRALTDELAREILTAWLDTPFGERGTDGVARLNRLDAELRRA